ncbi:unnamed protein product, partial [Urochloa humidicola]
SSWVAIPINLVQNPNTLQESAAPGSCGAAWHPTTAAKRCLFDQLQGDANSWLERLHDCAELERIKFCRGDEGGAAMNEMYRAYNYKKKLEDLTKATRTYFRNLVKAFETSLPEFSSVK